MAAQPMLIGNTALIVIDIQKSAFSDVESGIPVMPGYTENMRQARKLIDTRLNTIPVSYGCASN